MGDDRCSSSTDKASCTDRNCKLCIFSLALVHAILLPHQPRTTLSNWWCSYYRRHCTDHHLLLGDQMVVPEKEQSPGGQGSRDRRSQLMEVCYIEQCCSQPHGCMLWLSQLYAAADLILGAPFDLGSYVESGWRFDIEKSRPRTECKAQAYKDIEMEIRCTLHLHPIRRDLVYHQY